MMVKTYGMAFGDDIEEVEQPDMFARAGRPDRLEINLEIGNGDNNRCPSSGFLGPLAA